MIICASYERVSIKAQGLPLPPGHEAPKADPANRRQWLEEQGERAR